MDGKEIKKQHYEFNESEIKAIMDQVECIDGFPCFESRFKILCHAEPYGDSKLLECKEDNPLGCPRAYSYGEIFLCKCNVRNYIASNLKK